jgi:hypothetical protein
MPTVSLKDIDPVVFLHNVAIGADFEPDDKLHVKGGSLRIEHQSYVGEVGQGIKFRSLANNANRSIISWRNNLGVEKWRLAHDDDGDNTNDLRFVFEDPASTGQDLVGLALKRRTVAGSGNTSSAFNMGIYTKSPDIRSLLTIDKDELSAGQTAAGNWHISLREGGEDRWVVSDIDHNFTIKSLEFGNRSLFQIFPQGSVGLPTTRYHTLFSTNVGIGLPSEDSINVQRASIPSSLYGNQLLTVKGEARFYQDDPYDTGYERGIILSWDMTDNTGVIDTTDATTNMEFAIGGNTKYILEDGGDAGKSAGTEGWIQVNLGTRAAPKRGYIRVYTAK